MAEAHETDRAIGRLEGQLETITGMVTRVLDNQDRAQANLEAHAVEDRRDFADVKEALGQHRDRLSRVEAVADTVESHGDAILTMEKRLAARENNDKIRESLHQNNVRWMMAATGVGAAAGAGATSVWPKVWAAIIGVFK